MPQQRNRAEISDVLEKINRQLSGYDDSPFQVLLFPNNNMVLYRIDCGYQFAITDGDAEILEATKENCIKALENVKLMLDDSITKLRTLK